MNRLFPVLIALLGIFLGSCGTKSKSGQECAEDNGVCCCCPHTTLYLQPYNDYTQQQAEKLKREILANQADFGSVNMIDIKVLPNVKLADDLKNDEKMRFRADKILGKQKAQLEDFSTIIGLTHHDISTPYKGKKDWGVIGLSFRGKNVAIVSTFRMRNKKELWKAVAHEFCHAFYGAPHCLKGDPHCILQDAKGKYTFGRSPHLCDDCRSMY